MLPRSDGLDLMLAAVLSPLLQTRLHASLGQFATDPEWLAANEVYQKILQSGFEVYFAGGCVRDMLLGRKPHDFDLASSASPDELEKIFEKTIAVGKQFGILIVVQNGFEIEVARFRSEGKYVDGRRPESIAFASAEADAKRRDFTVNALFLSVGPLQVFDVVGGVADVEKRILRAVGDPLQRFQEDHLRVLRALRFESQLGFQMTESLSLAVNQSAALAVQVSGERYFEEWSKLLQGPAAQSVLQRLGEQGLMSQFFAGLRWEISEFEKVCQALQASRWDWNSLWVWAFASGSSEPELEAIWKSLKTSKEWQQDTRAALFWFLQPPPFPWSFGVMLQRIYQRRASLVGFQLWIHFAGLIAHEDCQHLLKLYQHWGEQQPAPWVKGGDLSDLYSGAQLGERLQKIFWWQLERRVTDPKSAIQLARAENFA